MLDILDLQKRYMKLKIGNGIDNQSLEAIENILELILPDDFKNITNFFNGGCLSIVDNYSFSEGKWNNILDETRRLRETVGLPQHFIVLAEPPESIIVMDVENKPSIIWCDATDISNLESKSYMTEPNTWENYSDFFGELLSDEEEETE